MEPLTSPDDPLFPDHVSDAGAIVADEGHQVNKDPAHAGELGDEAHEHSPYHDQVPEGEVHDKTPSHTPSGPALAELSGNTPRVRRDRALESAANTFDMFDSAVRISMADGLASRLEKDEKELSSTRVRFQNAGDKFERYKARYQAASKEYHLASKAFVNANKAVEDIQESLEALKTSLIRHGWQLTAQGWVKKPSALPESLQSPLSGAKRPRMSSLSRSPSPKDVETTPEHSG
ncbi:hypothetical protein KJ359_003479 [Pestalotiopsis sp. 9143b]|nr:hypothetical protein KJ359_003479 [Pestalotiopsis sp. 9143b]